MIDDNIFDRLTAKNPSATTNDPDQTFWHQGYPPKPFSEEWFIAKLTHGGRVVLKALPEEYSYDFKTADETYFKKERIRSWAQFPDSEYIPYETQIVTDDMLDALISALDVRAGYPHDHFATVYSESEKASARDWYRPALEAALKVKEMGR